MKKIILSLMLACTLLTSMSTNVFAAEQHVDCEEHIECVEHEITVQTQRQDAAHQMAEAARALGYSEDHPIILEAKSIWGQAAQIKVELNTKLEELKQPKLTYFGEFRLTGYCPCYKCCGKTDGITYSGVKAVEGITVAADIRKLPIGTKIYIEGLGERIVQDIGGAIKGNKLDIFYDTHGECYNAEANRTGVKVWIVEES